MDRTEALGLITTGLLIAGASDREHAGELAEHLLDEYLRDPLYRVEGVEVPVEVIGQLLENV